MKYDVIEEEVIDDDLHVKIIKRTQSPNWYIQFNDPVRGQRRASLKTRSVKEARRLAKQRAAELRMGHQPQTAQHNPLLHTIGERWLTHLREQGRTKETLQIYERVLRQFVWFANRHRTRHIHRLSTDLLESFQRELADPGLPVPDEHGKVTEREQRKTKPNGGKTIRDKMKILRELLNWSLARRYVLADPAAGYKLPPDPRNHGVCFTQAQVRAICAAAPSPYDDVFRFLALTGLRISELLWLTKHDIDRKRRLVLIQDKQIAETNESWSVLKGGDARAVPLSAHALVIAERAAARSAGPWLFELMAGRHGADKHKLYQQLSKVLDEAKQQACVTDGKFHAFRHAFCSYLANRNVSPFQVMKIMGHSSLDIVLRYYSVDAPQLVQAVDGAGLDELAVDPSSTEISQDPVKPAVEVGGSNS